eukprot:m.225104 g.225104  ORF g.225104 m.225104 type:complete len:456 (-) comp18783_c1_seq1:128-1495(-)
MAATAATLSRVLRRAGTCRLTPACSRVARGTTTAAWWRASPHCQVLPSGTRSASFMAVFRPHSCFRSLGKPGAAATRATAAVAVRSTATATSGAATAAAGAAASTAVPSRAVGWWLVGCAAMSFGAVVLGGVTRLTESGLSMVQWHPVKGVKPPSTHEEWLEEFELYKQFPEYKYSGGMTLAEFKRIWYMEYAHRMWGRSIGVAFLLPGAYFAARGRIQPRFRVPVLVLGCLLGFQGVLGWYMVKSGLEHDPQGKHVPRVSHYRLAAHLGSALLLYSGFLWTGLTHLLPSPTSTSGAASLGRFRLASRGMVALVFFTALSGAFVAGMDAGLVYNSFPMMGDRWIPEDMWRLKPWWLNFLENDTTVQFDHRVLGVTTVSAVTALWALARPAPLHPRARMAVNALFVMAYAQVALGISTLLWFVPTPLAATHQAGSVTLLSFALWLAHELRHVPKVL